MEETKEDKREAIFDLYNHLKCNIKSTNSNCEIHDSEFTNYCFQCKRSICDVCVEAYHSNHTSKIKSSIGMDKETVDAIFSVLESKIKNLTEFCQPDKIKQDLKNNINQEIKELNEKVEIYKNLKMKEIDDTFRNNSHEAGSLLTSIKDSRSKLIDFMTEFQPFLKGKSVSDEDNFIFLLNYDIINDGLHAGFEYIACLDDIKEYYKTCSCMKQSNIKDVTELLNTKIAEQKNISEMNDKISNEYTIDLNNNLINNNNSSIIMNPSNRNSKNFNSMNSQNSTFTTKTKKKETKKSLPNCQIDEVINDKKEQRKKFLENLEMLTDNKYKELVFKIDLLKEFLNGFKDNVYQNFKKHGSMIEIEKLVKMYEEKGNKRLNFSGKSGLKFSSSQANNNMKTGLTRSKATFQTMKKEDEKKNSTGEDLSSDKKKKDNTEQATEKTKEVANPAKKNSLLNTHMKRKQQLFSLDEKDGESISEGNDEVNNSTDDYLGMVANEVIDVKIENNVKMQDSKLIKRERMFKPLKRLYQRKALQLERKIRKKEVFQSSEQFKINNKLVELIKENQKLTNLIKSKEDICLQITTIRRYFAFMLLEFVRKNYRMSNKIDSNLFIHDSKKENETNNAYLNMTVKIEEGTNNVILFNKVTLKKEIKNVEFNKKKLGIPHCLVGSRQYFHTDRVYITGGKLYNEPSKITICYLLKENKIARMSDMNNARTFHSLIFHENLKSLVVIGGEDNATCEMYDFFLNSWTSIPSLNFPRANISVYIDKLGTFAYAICGILGNMLEGKYSDVIEFLDLIDMNQGWGKVEYKNKAEVDLKLGENKIFPIAEDKLVIYGGNESRMYHRCYCLFDLKKFEITKLDKENLELLMAKLVMHPEDI